MGISRFVVVLTKGEERDSAFVEHERGAFPYSENILKSWCQDIVTMVANEMLKCRFAKD